MRAALLDGYSHPLKVAGTPKPRPGAGQLLVRLEASGVCHTDVHIWKGETRPRVAPDPFILGHEGIGVVEDIGPGVLDWREGERAGAPWIHKTCGVCPECASGEESFCQTHFAHGFDVPGTFAEYVLLDAAHAVRLPPGDAAALAPLMCAGLTAFGAVRRAGVLAGETCAVFGCGGLGLYAVQFAVRAGARVVAIDRDEAKLAKASAAGAHRTARAHAALAEEWSGRPFADACINFAPTTATWSAMLASVKPRGRIVAAAMVSEPVPLNQEWLVSTGVRITGTSVGTRADMRELLALHAREPLASEVTRIRLEEASDALASLDRGNAPGRYCITF